MSKQTIYLITPETALDIVKRWEQGDESIRELYLANDGSKYIAIDNTSGECYVEEFTSRNNAIKWLTEGYCN